MRSWSLLGPITALGVDVGGTKVEVGLIDVEGRVLHRQRAVTIADDGEAFWSVLAGLAEGVLAEGARHGIRPSVVGVGCGGPMSAGGVLVSPLNITGWRGFPLRARLAELTGLPAFVDNDAKALALAEGWRGAAVAHDDYLAMVVSTGVGGGLVVDGRLLDGATGNAGHIGHVIVEPNGRVCGCGAQGCLEAEASGTAIARITGRPAAEAGEDVRVRTGTLVGRAVASVVAALDLRLACVAGSVALGFGDLFFDAAQAELDRSARLEFAHGVRIVRAGCGDEGPLVGAAAVGLRGLAAS